MASVTEWIIQSLTVLHSIKNSLNPHWTTHFDLDYSLGELIRINVGIYDEIRKSQQHKPMGSAMFEVGEVLGSRGNVKAKQLRKGGTVFLRVTAAPESSVGTLELTLHGQQLKNVDGMFGKSDPFYEVLARVEAAGGITWQPVYRSKHVMNNLNPQWTSASIDLHRLCEGDYNRPVRIRLWDWQKNGKHTTMGEIETTVNGILQAVGDVKKAFLPTHRGKQYGKLVVRAATISGASPGGTPAAFAPPTTAAIPQAVPPPQQAPLPQATPVGDIPDFAQALDVPPPKFSTMATVATAASTFSASRPPPTAPTSSAPAVPFVPTAYQPAVAIPPPILPPKPKPSFIDYMMGGCELDMCVAIDFTGSNGDPRRPGTLHYIHPDGQLNDYEKAITAVGSIIARYDADQKFPVWGFGAKYSGVLQHCFQVGPTDKLDGISGILDGYRGVFRSGLTMSGPTVFAEVINMAAAQARSAQEASARIGRQSYRVLLILTDGAVSDVELTKSAIHQASDAPLSIVIVGIGQADFSAMQFLDDFQSNGHGGRDICQFVEFSRHQHDKRGLTKETLDEIPDQLVDFFFSKGIMPLPGMTGSQISLNPSLADEEDIDLNIDINTEGEISLANYDGAVYDDTKYDTYANYAGGYHPSGPSSMSTSAPFVPHNPPPAFNPSASMPPSQPYSAPPAPYRPQASYQPYQAPAPPPAASPAPGSHPIFHVQVPPGVTAGQQLRIENPFTKQQMIVTVPPGVAPGGVFGVRS